MTDSKMDKLIATFELEAKDFFCMYSEQHDIEQIHLIQAYREGVKAAIGIAKQIIIEEFVLEDR